MNNLQKMVDLFQPNPIVEKIMGQLADKILELDQRRNLPCGYLKTALALHLPQYPLDTLCLGGQDDLTANRQFLNVQGEQLAKMIYDKIHSLPTELKKMTLLARRTSKIVHHSKEIIEVDNDGRERPVYFARVDPNIGELIQQKLHYIGYPRDDTLFHFGLFRQRGEFPFAYAAFSILDRKYVQNNLPFELPMNNLLVLTRSFNINNSPENAMSLLFSQCRQFFKKNLEVLKFEAILTAANPNLFFKAVSFRACWFFPFATTPFEPLYYHGRYITRKHCQKEFGTEKKRKLLKREDMSKYLIVCQSTVWLGCGISQEIFDQFVANKKIKVVTSREYQKG